MATTPPEAAQAAPAPEQLPSAGGSYIRMADGSLQPAPADSPNNTEATTPQE